VIETTTHTSLRDRALLGVLAYTFARIGAVVNLKVEDYYPSGKRFLLRFKEKGGKEKELPVHHKLEELLDEYLKATGLGTEPGSPLFPAALGKTGKLSRRPLVRTDAADMLKRRLKQAGLPAHYSPHSFRATGITNFLENDGTLEAAQRIAGHADSRTTKLYDRRGQKVLLEDMERIRASQIGPWLDTPNPAFEGSTPLQVIERGESDRLWRMIWELRMGNSGD
jgi:integrase/recombinase XerD